MSLYLIASRARAAVGKDVSSLWFAVTKKQEFPWVMHCDVKMELAAVNWKLVFERVTGRTRKGVWAKHPPALVFSSGFYQPGLPLQLWGLPWKWGQVLQDFPGHWKRKEEMERFEKHPVRRWSAKLRIKRLMLSVWTCFLKSFGKWEFRSALC